MAKLLGATHSIATPAGRPAGFVLIFALRRTILWLSRFAVFLARWMGKPLRLGSAIFVARHEDVIEVLSRDLDFRIQPVDGPRFDQIGFHFILGMDRSAELARERHALYAALAAVDMKPVRDAAAKEISGRIELAPGAIDLVHDYARPVAASTAQALFGIAPENETQFMDASRAIFGHCFLNIANDPVITQRAMDSAVLVRGWFAAEIQRRRENGDLGQDMMGHLLRAGNDDDLTCRTLGGMLVGSIDTTATAVAKIMTVLIADPVAMAGATQDIHHIRRLYGWCQEALRRWPQTPMLIRQAPAETQLGGVAVPANSTIWMLTQAAMHDASAFPDPKRMRPDRPTAAYLHLGEGLHACAGRGISAWQIPMLIGGLLSRKPTQLEPMRWAGPFPAHLIVRFGEEAA